MSKQEFLLHFSASAHSCKQYLRDHPQSLEGRMRDDARYLGPRIVLRDNAASEVGRRLASSRASFRSLGGIWSLDLPYRWKRV
eukprot:8585498-Pyramimonas_sp.AAC.1